MQGSYDTQGTDIENRGLVNATFLANVDLPHGAVVTKLTLRYSETFESDEINLYLQRSNQTGDYDTMATVSSLDGYDAERSTTAISNATIDNEWYHYWLNLDLPIEDSSYSMNRARCKNRIYAAFAQPQRHYLHIRRRFHPFLRRLSCS